MPQSRSLRLPCTFAGCSAKFKSYRGRTYHVRTKHHLANAVRYKESRSLSDSDSSTNLDGGPAARQSPPASPNLNFDQEFSPSPPPEIAPQSSNKSYHPHLTGAPCDMHGNPLPQNTPPPPRPAPGDDDWIPFNTRQQFEIADLLFRKVEMSAANIDELFAILGLMVDRDTDDLRQSDEQGSATTSFDSHKDMYDTIDASSLGDAPWNCLEVCYGDNVPDTAAPWKKKVYEVWYRDPDVVLRNLLDNPDFDGEFDYAPYVETVASGNGGQRRWSNFMSANFAWRHSTSIFEENKEQNQGAMYSAIILGSDKTTVSVATGQVEYHPLYMSIGNIHNNVRRAHRQGVVPVAFLAIPKSDRRYDTDVEFRKFKRHLYHTSVSAIFQSIKAAMSTPVVRRCPDGHFRRVVFDFGPFIGDYPEQVMLAGVVGGWCARCTALCTDLDNPEYSVYLPALVGFVPLEMLKAFQTFLDFCYLVRRPSFTPGTITQVQETLTAFHNFRKIFITAGVRETISLPRQHSLVHYSHLIQEFGAPGGLCSSITESRHITAVKKPWRRSSRWEALGQMLTTNQRLDKLAAMRTDFEERGMIPISRDVASKQVNNPLDDEGCEPVDEIVEGNVVLARTRIRNYPRKLDALGELIGYPQLHELTRRFLYDHLYPHALFPSNEIVLEDCPSVYSKIAVFHSAIATFYAPSDISGIHGMRRERIRSTPDWRGGGERRDCALIVEDQNQSGFGGMSVVRIRLLFSFKHDGITIPCALVEWFKQYGQRPDASTGMWIVRPETTGGHRESPLLTVVHLDTLFRLAHLMPVFNSTDPLPDDFEHSYTLDAFKSFYLNKYIDYHAFETLCS
ncbi:hypothetical protein EYR36_010658 [Pleurotus pulmonarius]|nr:hypothetical protein EYR36_010784 [Pleurotus pulmonarius]KAF4568645.1 hypothetical protein EYR36_010658 [Pleurotus pulmonarius]